MEYAQGSTRVDYCFELSTGWRMLRRIGELYPQRGGPVIDALMAWIVFVRESHAASYGKGQPELGGLEDHRILVASVIELLGHILVGCASSNNSSLILRQSNPRVQGRTPQDLTARVV